MTAQPGRCSFSAEKVRSSAAGRRRGNHHFTYLPLLKLVLFRLVLLDEIIQDLFQAFCICLECGDHILDSPLHQDAIDQAEALAILRKGHQGFKNKSI